MNADGRGNVKARIVILCALLLAALAVAPAAHAFSPKRGYWDGKLGKRASRFPQSPEVQLLLNKDWRYQIGLYPTLICSGGRRVRVELTLSKLCPLSGGNCGPYGRGFSWRFRFKNRTRLSGTWKLDTRNYPGCRAARGDRHFTARWRARPKLTITPSAVKRGGTVNVRGSGYIPREPINTAGNIPIWALSHVPLYKADRHGRFNLQIPIWPTQTPGYYPDVYVYQRSCQTSCWVKGSVPMTILP